MSKNFVLTMLLYFDLIIIFSGYNKRIPQQGMHSAYSIINREKRETRECLLREDIILLGHDGQENEQKIWSNIFQENPLQGQHSLLPE